MPRVLVVLDNGDVFWNERVRAEDFETEHFKGGLADRLGWAVADAQVAANEGAGLRLVSGATGSESPEQPTPSQLPREGALVAA